MYQVIARTWRPQKFSEVIGQRHVTQTLQNAIRLNRIGHGYIFSGQRGTGKTTVARLLAKALNCQKGPAPEPCGECDSCREIAAGRAVDVIEIDAASNRGIDAVRELRENARYAPARDRYKIFIIDEAHQITTEGFNALLKTLEEPPAHVVFLLATTEVHQFPETILSRCQHFSLHALAFAEYLGHLEKICAAEEVEADAEALAVLAKSGEGSIRDALSRLEQAIAAFGSRLEGPAVRRFLGEPPSSLIEEVFNAVKEQKREAMLQVVEKLVTEGYQLTHFCSQLIRTVRNLLVIRVAGPDQRLLECSAEESRQLAALAEGFTEESLMRSLEILLRLHQEFRYSQEPRFQMELGLLKLVDAEKLVAIEDLLAQMEATPSQRVEPKASPGLPAGRPSSSAVPSVPMPAPAVEAGQSPRPRLTPWEQDQIRKKQWNEPSGAIAVSPESVGGSGAAIESNSGVGVAVAEDAPSSPTAGTDAPSREDGWIDAILAQLEEQSRQGMASILAGAKAWEFGEAELKIRFADEGMLKIFSEADRQHLEKLCPAVVGRRLKVTLAADRQAPSAEARQAGARQAGGAKAPASADSRINRDPDILEFERVFGTRVTPIRDWKE